MTSTTTRASKRRIPSLCLHKATGQAVVRLDGKDIYCGRYGTPEAQEKYERLIAEWLLTGRQVSPPADAASPPVPQDLTVNELVLAYWSRHVTTYYVVKRGRPTSEQDNIRQALRFARRLSGGTLAARFGPLALKAVREAVSGLETARVTLDRALQRLQEGGSG